MSHRIAALKLFASSPAAKALITGMLLVVAAVLGGASGDSGP
jgi:hypothetical protein